MNIEIAMKYTDINYCNKNEVQNKVGSYSSESVWKIVSDYRDKYRFPLDIKLYELRPSSVVLTPQIMAIANSLDILMCEYYSKLNLYSVYERFSDEKKYTYFKNDCLKYDLYKLANFKDLDVTTTNLETILEYANIKNIVVKNYHDAYKYLINNQDTAFDKATLREIVRYFNMGVDNPNFYRDDDVLFNELGCNYSHIGEHIQMLFNLYNDNYELSPFIIASIVMIYFIYINPLKDNSKEVAALLFNKALQCLKYNEASYFVSVVGLLNNENYSSLLSKIEDYKKTGDITYPLTFVLSYLKKEIKTRINALNNIPLPTLYEDGVKVVTKEIPVEVVKEVVKEVPVEVEKEVVKEVPVEIVKEVVKEVPIEVIKEVEVPVEVEKEVIKEVIKEVPVEVVKEVPYETIKEVIKEVPVEVIKEVTVYKDRPVEVIKEVEVPVEVIKEVTKEVPVEVIKEVVKEVPVEIVKEIIKEVPIEIVKEVPVEVIKEVVKEVPVENQVIEDNNEVEYVEEVDNEVVPQAKEPKVEVKKETNSVYHKFSKQEIKNILNEGNIANKLVQLNPYIRDYQARYYEQNHEYGMFYTISSFKDFAYCAYETARTSMDFLCEIGLYEKRQIKNKFIYTPVSLED